MLLVSACLWVSAGPKTKPQRLTPKTVLKHLILTNPFWFLKPKRTEFFDSSFNWVTERGEIIWLQQHHESWAGHWGSLSAKFKSAANCSQPTGCSCCSDSARHPLPTDPMFLHLYHHSHGQAGRHYLRFSGRGGNWLLPQLCRRCWMARCREAQDNTEMFFICAGL